MVAFWAELWFNCGMEKQKAIDLLGGTVGAAARALGVSYQAVDKWPPVLSTRVADRVLGAYARMQNPSIAQVKAVISAPTQEQPHV